VPKEAQLDLAPVFALLHDKRWAIRHAAIRSLINTASSAAEDQVLELLRTSTDPRDVVYCHATLNRIGTMQALSALEAGLKSRNRDVKESAKAAIEAIAERDSLGTSD
jgi:HEAT repeat protein